MDSTAVVAARKEPAPYATALVTGASSGLGRGLSLWLARRGVTVHAAARRRELLEELAREAAASGGRVVPVVLDLADPASCLAAVRAIDAEQPLELVIAAAGLESDTAAQRLDWEEVERVLSVNVLGAAATLTAALPAMVGRNRGHLVAISSLAGYRGMPAAAPYSASKAFLSTFVESLRVDLRDTGVRVTDLRPGYVRTPMTEKYENIPMLLELDDAVERMGKAILSRRPVLAFPFPLSAMASLARWLPATLWDRLVGGGQRRMTRRRLG